MSCTDQVLNSYECAEKGTLLPLVSEYTWPKEGRATLYIIGLLWFFLGVSIIADIFMQAIEMITSRTRVVRIPDPDNEHEYIEIDVKLWNGTVANLTLMALGSSAPEILLSILEVFFNGYMSGPLGPSTIVGSAAFNFLCITGVCIMAIPTNETRRIQNIKVFALTAFFSIFAYLWLIIILVAITPDYVDLWEAIVTLLMFPILVVLAYILDKNFCGKPEDQMAEKLALDGEKNDGESEKNAVLKVLKRLRHERDVTEDDMARIAAFIMADEQSHDRGWYRINATRELTGGAKLAPKLTTKTEELMELLIKSEGLGSTESLSKISEGGTKAVIEFASPVTACSERDGVVRIYIMRHGNQKKRVLFRLETVDGTACANTDYVPRKETLVFEANESSKCVDIEIVDDNEWEPDEVFFVRLSVEPDQPAVIGTKAITQIIIQDDDEPGTLTFSNPSFLFKESVGVATVTVVRRNGSDGTVSVKWETKDITAVGGMDYLDTQGVLVFDHGETEKSIEIRIKDDQEFEKDENFEVSLKETTGGALVGKLNRCVVSILNDDDFKGVYSRMLNLTNTNLDMMKLKKASWGKQFHEAFNVNGGDVDNARPIDYLMHFLTFVWKVLFAFVPPPSIMGGWLCFFVSLVMIGIMTALISDLASIFGCLVGLRDPVTAITFVALGTSLPDLFASKKAAVQERHADVAIGNVTGSNSVNVFLGLGLSWVIASIYWTAQGKTFYVPAGSLTFSVALYTIFSVAGMALLLMRRNMKLFGMAELGGPTGLKMFSGVLLIFFWFLYFILSSLEVYEHIEGF
ncbi:hypothetical protein ScPMuIL_004373 [Solemya velum]